MNLKHFKQCVYQDQGTTKVDFSIVTISIVKWSSKINISGNFAPLIYSSLSFHCVTLLSFFHPHRRAMMWSIQLSFSYLSIPEGSHYEQECISTFFICKFLFPFPSFLRYQTLGTGTSINEVTLRVSATVGNTEWMLLFESPRTLLFNSKPHPLAWVLSSSSICPSVQSIASQVCKILKGQLYYIYVAEYFLLSLAFCSSNRSGHTFSTSHSQQQRIPCFDSFPRYRSTRRPT